MFVSLPKQPGVMFQATCCQFVVILCFSTMATLFSDRNTALTFLQCKRAFARRDCPQCLQYMAIWPPTRDPWDLTDTAPKMPPHKWTCDVPNATILETEIEIGKLQEKKTAGFGRGGWGGAETQHFFPFW